MSSAYRLGVTTIYENEIGLNYALPSLSHANELQSHGLAAKLRDIDRVHTHSLLSRPTVDCGLHISRIRTLPHKFPDSDLQALNASIDLT